MYKFPPNNLEKIGWLDVRGDNRDGFIVWGREWTGRKRLHTIVVGH